MIRRSLKWMRKPESEDQNETRKALVVEDPKKDVQSKYSTPTSSMTDLTLPSSSESHWVYDVFLSFRGEDTRKNFTDNLYSTLKQVGIRIFRDDEELPRGENISTELLNAIRGSRIFIVVFSKNYASSKWCLNELVEIMNCKKTRGQTLLPIFYHVDPSDVRKQIGPFAKAFSSHISRFQIDMERVQRWREALTEAANCAGWDLDANGYESRIIKKIVEEVLCKVNPAHLDVAIHPVGIQSRVEEIKVLLNLGTKNICIVGFYGMGGIGKTTLAKAVYNEICHGFEGSSFLSNIKEISKKSNGLVHLQEQLLYDILHTKNLNVDNVDRGINLIKERIHGKKVLVVLDDVDYFKQLHALVGNCKLFGPGSRLIATTRDEQVLTQLGVDEKYKVEQLNPSESLQLFRWHAFKMAYPIEEYLELSFSAAKYTGGLPLALEVLGSSLLGKSVDEWKSKLEKLQKIPDGKIQEKLKISFDSLDYATKGMFLDIACFFIGIEKEYVIKILHACDFFPDIGLNDLIQRSLVTIDDKKLGMHDLIRDMGREIVLAESPYNPGRRSRLWFDEDILKVLRNHMGSETVEGLILNPPILEGVPLETDAFRNMKNLRLLQINDVHLTGSYENLSKELKWLCWHKCPLNFLPQKFHLENLVILDMQHSNVKQVWKKKKNFNKLNVLNLSNSKDLTTSPDFSQVPQLEILILEGCTSLVQVHESIGNLKRLVSLNLKNCTNLKDLPNSIFNLESLEILDLSGCLALEKLPEQLPSSFGVLKNLKTLSLYGCSGLTELPNFLQAPHLKSLVLEGCTSLVKIHESIGLLERLVLLDFRRCEKLKNLPSSISNLESLETLDLSGCFALEKLPEQLPSSFGLLKNLKTVSLYGCSRLSALPNFLHATHLESLKLEGCTSLVKIHESIGLLKKLVLLDLRRCEKLKNLPNSISNLESLEILDLSGCLKLYKLPKHLGNMTALWKLVVDGTVIKQLPSSLGHLRNLSVLSFSGCGGPFSSWISLKSSNHIICLPRSICRLSSLRELNLSDRNLSENEIPSQFEHLYSLEILDLSRNNFRILPNCISCLPELQYLYLNECTTLQSISLHKSVQLLGANGCILLERILILVNESSGSFYLDNCHKLAGIQCLNSLQPGSAVFMGRCNNLAYEFRKSVVFQMVCETDGDCSFCLPGSEIPKWISHQTIGSLISFRVPSFLDGQIGRLLLCVVYAENKEAPKLSHRDGLFKLTFCNKSFRDPHKSYWRTCFDISEDHICAQVMQFNQIGLEMNSGDEIELSIDLLTDGRPMEDHQQSIKVKKCGIHLLPRCGGPSSSWISSKSSDRISLLPPFSELRSLKHLNLSDHNLSEDEIPIEFGFLSSLKTLDLSRNNFRNLSAGCISCLPKLQDLHLNDCIALQSISLPRSVIHLRAYGCTSLEIISISCHPKLQNLHLNDCTALQSISLPTSVIFFSANGCTSLERISIVTNKSSGSSSLDNLDELQKISSSLHLDNCLKLVEIQRLESLRCLPRIVHMGSCNKLSSDFRKSVFQMMFKTDGDCIVHLPGSEIPDWISHQANGSSISFCVPDGKISKVLFCIVYAVNKRAPIDRLDQGGYFRWRLRNKSSSGQSNNWGDWNRVGGDSAMEIISRECDIFKDHILAQVSPGPTNYMWSSGNRRMMKSGDEIEVAIDLQRWHEFVHNYSIMNGIDPQIVKVKRCGIHLLVDEHEPNVGDYGIHLLVDEHEPNVRDDEISESGDYMYEEEIHGR